jgi:malate synthase
MSTALKKFSHLANIRWIFLRFYEEYSQKGGLMKFTEGFEIIHSTVSVRTLAELFPPELQKLLIQLHGEFEKPRQDLLLHRSLIQKEYNKGEVPRYITDHPAHQGPWSVAAIPDDMLDRRVEITGPVCSTKMVINLLSANAENQVANTAMLDFEDSMAPTWENVVAGLKNLVGVAQENLVYFQPAMGTTPAKEYRLDPTHMAHPMVRVRGLHMLETHVRIHGQPISAGLFDLACSAYHTAAVYLQKNKTPKFYVPKTEHFLEARWWNQVFGRVEEGLHLPKASLRVTFLIETLPAAFQMEEILYEIRERACGLNGGRWDKIFSDIKTLRYHKDRIMADRSTIDMSKSWMDNYAKRLVKVCHSHGAFAMGGMSAFTPGKEAEVRQRQTEKVITDKARESRLGHDGCWVSHPYFVGIARNQFPHKNQLSVTLPDFPLQPDLLPQSEGPKTLEGLRTNLRVGIAYQQGLNQGLGCIAFENLMEDLATLEISRAQTWQWLYHRIELDDGPLVTPELVETLFSEELERILSSLGNNDYNERETYRRAHKEIKEVFLNKELPDFFNTQTHQ